MSSKAALVVGSILLWALLLGALNVFRDGGASWAADPNKIARVGQLVGAALVPAFVAALGTGLTKLVWRSTSFWTAWLVIYWLAAVAFLLSQSLA
jgi:hypothetical protein